MTDASEPPHSGDPPPGGADDPTFGPGALPGDAGWSVGSILKERYRIDKVIGRGGMGEVWLAHDTVLDRRVALKRALASRTSDAQRRNLILKEARGISAISDRRIAAIHDVFEVDDTIVLVMEYVDGVTLRERMADTLRIDEFWDLAIQCVEALVVAHRHGIIHRDIKPDNLMITEQGQVKILDFGLAKQVDSSQLPTTVAPTESTHIAGTPTYMAPETHRGKAPDERTDMFSLGVVFYEVLTGELPFRGDTYAAIAEQAMNHEPPAVLERNPESGEALSHIVGRMLAKDPAARYESTAVLLEQLLLARRQSVSSGEGSFASLPPGSIDPAWTTTQRTPPRRRGKVMALVTLLAVVVAAGLVWRFSGGDASLPTHRNLAVLPPEFLSSDGRPTTDEDFFFLGATEILNRLLRTHTLEPDLQMGQFREIVSENIQSATEARKVLGVNLVLRPRFVQETDAYLVSLQLLDPVADTVLRQRELQAPTTDPHGFILATYETAAAMLELTPRVLDARDAIGVRGAGTLQFHLQGLGRVRVAGDEEELQFAIDDFELGCRTEPESGVLRAGLATAQRQAYRKTRDTSWLQQAEAAAREAVALDDRAETQRILGFTQSSLKDRAAAGVAFERARAQDPTDDRVILWLARNYGRMGQPEKEREVYLAAIESRPHNWRPHWWLATWHYRQGDMAAAIESYHTMIEAAPDLYKGYTNLGGLQVLQGDYRGAIESLERSVRLRPTRTAFSNMGTAHFNLRDFASAVGAYNQAFQFGFADYALWLNLGDAYHWLKDRADQAREAYEQAVRLALEERDRDAREGRSYDVMIAAHLAALYPKLGHEDSARVYLEEALAAGGNNPMVQYNAALTHWQLQEPEDALQWLEKSVAGGYPRVWLRDSAVFDDWRGLQRFRGIVAEAEEEAAQHSKGG